MQGAEAEGDGSVLPYVTEPEFRKQRSRSPLCNCLDLVIQTPVLIVPLYDQKGRTRQYFLLKGKWFTG